MKVKLRLQVIASQAGQDRVDDYKTWCEETGVRWNKAESLEGYLADMKDEDENIGGRSGAEWVDCFNEAYQEAL